MCSVGCVHKGVRYKIGDQWAVSFFVFFLFTEVKGYLEIIEKIYLKGRNYLYVFFILYYPFEEY